MIAGAGILIDITRCIGCEQCVAACKKENHLPDDRLLPGQGTFDGLSSSRFCTVLSRPHHHFALQQCRHCLEPACVSACPVGAMQKTTAGPVIYDSSLCMGCRYCLVSCPYAIPRYEWSDAVPYVRKCIMCYPRLTQGKQPACVEACPEHATIFGERADLVRIAHERIAANPGKYLPHVYGEHEGGGTSVMYLSDIPLDFLAWGNARGDQPLPRLSWASLREVPGIALGMGTLMTVVYWVIRRRMRLAAPGATGSQEGGATRSAAPGAPHDA